MNRNPLGYFVLGMVGCGFAFVGAMADNWALFLPGLLLACCCQVKLLAPFVRNYRGLA